MVSGKGLAKRSVPYVSLYCILLDPDLLSSLQFYDAWVARSHSSGDTFYAPQYVSSDPDQLWNRLDSDFRHLCASVFFLQ